VTYFNECCWSQTFYHLLTVYLCAIAGGIPFFVMRDFFQQRLALRWREWMTEEYVNKYFDDRSFYRIQVGLKLATLLLTTTPNPVA
jgi:ABC-type uncharacterized transport system fused permease/ATPase subunit